MFESMYVLLQITVHYSRHVLDSQRAQSITCKLMFKTLVRECLEDYVKECRGGINEIWIN